jgi:hypothetical protein
VTTYQDSTAANGTTYFYVVAAQNSVGVGPRSNEASAAPASATVPTPPRNLVAAPAKPRGVALTWATPTSNGGSPITGYQVFRGTSAGTETFLVTVGNVTSYKDTSAARGVAYWYYVIAVNAVGASPESNEASATAR